MNLVFCFGPKLRFWTWTKLNKKYGRTKVLPLLRDRVRSGWEADISNLSLIQGLEPSKNFVVDGGGG